MPPAGARNGIARWESGDPAVCKTVDAGSIPARASCYLVGVVEWHHTILP